MNLMIEERTEDEKFILELSGPFVFEIGDDEGPFDYEFQQDSLKLWSVYEWSLNNPNAISEEVLEELGLESSVDVTVVARVTDLGHSLEVTLLVPPGTSYV